MKIAICDDEQEILDEVKEYVKQFDSQFEVFTYQNISDFEVEDGIQYDLVFMDIELGEENGILLAKKIKEQYPTTMIAFITAHDKYIREVFDAQPCGFIDKPIQKEEIERVLNLVRENNGTQMFSYEIAGKQYTIYLDEICYVMSMGRKIILRTRRGDIEYYGKLNEEAKILTEKSRNFIRIGQSVVVNRKYIVGINYTTIDVNYNGKIEQLSITQKYRERVSAWYKEELKWKR